MFAPIEDVPPVLPPPPPPGSPRRSVLVGLALSVAVLLVAAAVGLAVTRSDDDDAVSTTPTSSGARSTTSAVPPSERELIATLERFVEQARGLKFKRPVEVTFLDDAAFRARVKEVSEEDSDELEEAGDVLRALGLLEPDVDMAKTREELLGVGVAGFYDPKKKDLVVRGTNTTPYVRGVLVHELTHALQDQHFDLDRPELDKRDDEAADGFGALVEGDAVRIQEAYEASLSTEDRKASAVEGQAQASGVDVDRFPVVLLQLLTFPYSNPGGLGFVEEVFKAGGQARIDAAFARPPTTTEQVLEPGRYLAGDVERPVGEPKADGKTIDKGVLGELGLVLVLDADLPGREAGRAAQGWGGDRYVAWRDGKRTCVRVNLVMDTPNDAAELRSAVLHWADQRSGATVAGGENGTPLTLTTCA